MNVEMLTKGLENYKRLLMSREVFNKLIELGFWGFGVLGFWGDRKSVV